MIVTYEDFEIRPYPNELCWEVFERREVKKADGSKALEMKSTGHYPQNLPAALSFVRERKLKRGEDAMTLDAALVAVKQTNDGLRDAVTEMLDSKGVLVHG